MKQETKFLPISEYQKRFFLEWTLAPKEILYNVSLVNKITGNLNRIALKQASEEVIKCNEVFFVRYSKNGETCWYCDFLIDDFYQESTFDPKQPLELQLREILNRTFDLTKDVLVRFYLIKNENADNEYYFIMSGHHIIADAIHALQISTQIQNAYNELVEGKSVSLNIDKTFTKAVEAEQNILTQEYKTQAQKFWLDFIGDFPLNVELPYRSDVDVSDFNNLLADKTGESIFFDLTKLQSAQLKAYAKEKRTTLFILFSALYGLVLSKYCNQDKLLLSYPVNMRPKGFKEVTGCFVNNVPLKLDFTRINTINELLNLLGEQRKEAKHYQGYSLTDIIHDQRKANDREISSFFNVGFTQTSLNTTSLKLKGLDVSPIDISWNEKIVNEIGLLYDEYSSEVIKFRFEYRKVLFDNDLIQRFVNSFKKAVDDIINSGELLIKEYSLLNNEEYDYIIYRWNETKNDYPRNKTICQLFQEQVDKSPDDIAVVCNDQKLTYKELNHKSNQLARYILRNYKERKGTELTPDTLIPLFMDRGLEVLIGILAVLKAGGAYVPIDITYPKKRVDYILDNTQAEIILSLRKIVENPDVELPSSKVLCIDLKEELFVNEDKTNLPSLCKSTDLAYVIYTSGTTGNPKGVLIEHQSLVNYVIWGSKIYVRDEKVSFPLYTSISFDLTVTSIFIPLISGNTIFVYPENANSLPIEDVIRDNKIHILKATPSHLKILKESHLFRQEEYYSNIKRFIVGGESFTNQLANEIDDIFKGKVEIYNEYGPTEATVGCMIYEFDTEKDKNETVPIGIPIDNANIYLLDNNLKPVPVGVVGHMHISGDCLARGYLFRPELTDEKFLINPYFAGKKMYKTGDLAKRLLCGDIEFIGRSDQQIKVNGYRVELEEIESCIQKFDGIKSVVVLMLEKSDSSKLCAYYEADVEVENGALRDFMQKQLPYYMIPSLLQRVDRIPLTSNGKVDRNALLSLDVLENLNKFRNAENELQGLLVDVFQNVLGVSNIGIDDKFFELGGDSIKAVQITSRLYDKGYSLNVKDILTHQTISQISILVEKSEKDYEQGLVSGEMVLTPIEHWFFGQKFEHPHYYNQSVLLEFKNRINKEAIELAFSYIIRHHDGLRLNYDPLKKCMFYENAYIERPFAIEEYVVAENEDLLRFCEEIKSGFNIGNTLLIKCGILREKGENDYLLITAHHLIIDGLSWRILLDDLITIITALNNNRPIDLPKKTASLIDWENTLAEYSNSDTLLKQHEYWKEFEIDIPPIFPKTQQKDNSKQNFGIAHIILDQNQTDYLIKDANKSYNTDIQILLVTALARTLKEWTNKGSLAIELESHGRNLDKADVSRTIGWFTSIYPIMIDVKDDNFENLIKSIKERIRKVPDSGIGYGIYKFMQNKKLDIKCCSDVRFNYLGHFGKELSNDFFSYCNRSTGLEMSQSNTINVNLEVNSMIILNELDVMLYYNKNVFNDLEIEKFKNIYLNNIENLISHLQYDNDIHFTPSDFDSLEISEEDLSLLFKD